ncbi:uncharacterized protein A4U43_C04F8590 [Asparagus officinalis]|uniref:Noroxomaritidine/norcraugsodine reductase n=1 Tax=Asparagus officinalis TaxID=4686 RepID=A0A5P1F4Q1_ASPOF|nr:uncharacterized protein A4U43_C04F8590 [Asparagus officinalis]
MVDGKRKYALNGVSHVDAEVPLKLAEYYNASERVFQYDLIGDLPPQKESRNGTGQVEARKQARIQSPRRCQQAHHPSVPKILDGDHADLRQRRNVEPEIQHPGEIRAGTAALHQRSVSGEIPEGRVQLEGKVALITGGVAESASARDLGGAASFIHCDVTNEDDVSKAVDHAVEKFGQLDIMFNNAGITGPAIPSTVDYPKSDFERVLSINLTGAFLGIKHAARVMIPNGRGSIVSTSSIAGVGGGMGTHAYTSAKHAVVGLTKNAAVELGQFGVRVNCVSPYATATPLAMNAMGFADREEGKFERAVSMCGNLKGTTLEKEDVAGAVMYLGSDEAKYVSGHNLVVDGGYTVVNTGLNRVNDFR